MLNDKTYSEANGLARTRQEKNLFLDELNLLSDALYASQPGAFEDALNKQVRLKTANLIHKLLAGGEEGRTVVDNLRKFIETAKTVKITLAFEPREETLDKLFAWVIKNLGTPIIMDISFDESIVGGAIVVIDGKYRDLSLKKRISELFQNKEMTFNKLLAQ